MFAEPESDMLSVNKTVVLKFGEHSGILCLALFKTKPFLYASNLSR